MIIGLYHIFRSTTYLSFYTIKRLYDKCTMAESISIVYHDVRIVRRVRSISQGRIEFDREIMYVSWVWIDIEYLNVQWQQRETYI